MPDPDLDTFPYPTLRLVNSCQMCGKEDPDLAHGIWELVAAVLAQPLRDAFDHHMDTHRCGFIRCPEAIRLFLLLPAGDRVEIA